MFFKVWKRRILFNGVFRTAVDFRMLLTFVFNPLGSTSIQFKWDVTGLICTDIRLKVADEVDPR